MIEHLRAKEKSHLNGYHDFETLQNNLHRYKKRMARMRGMKRKAEVTRLTNGEHDENPNVNRYSIEREEAIQLKIL